MASCKLRQASVPYRAAPCCIVRSTALGHELELGRVIGCDGTQG